MRLLVYDSHVCEWLRVYLCVCVWAICFDVDHSNFLSCHMLTYIHILFIRARWWLLYLYNTFLHFSQNIASLGVLHNAVTLINEGTISFYFLCSSCILLLLPACSLRTFVSRADSDEALNNNNLKFLRFAVCCVLCVCALCFFFLLVSPILYWIAIVYGRDEDSVLFLVQIVTSL